MIFLFLFSKIIFSVKILVLVIVFVTVNLVHMMKIVIYQLLGKFEFEQFFLLKHEGGKKKEKTYITRGCHVSF